MGRHHVYEGCVCMCWLQSVYELRSSGLAEVFRERKEGEGSV